MCRRMGNRPEQSYKRRAGRRQLAVGGPRPDPAVQVLQPNQFRGANFGDGVGFGGGIRSAIVVSACFRVCSEGSSTNLAP